ncbi:MAG: CRISPR-associated protein Cas4 [Pseudomonadota bacterium]
MFDEDDLLPISALQHLAFCERQWGLIHLEGLWEENRLTAEGRILHDHVHEAGSESRPDLRVVRGLRLRSLELGLTGVADVVEFQREPGAKPGGPDRPFPVEYKRGRPKHGRCDEIQLCAQALCLEEMLRVDIPAGALYYGRPRRRTEILFDAVLRRETEAAVERLHALSRAARTPPGRFEPKCRRCSLLDQCLPKTAGQGKSAAGYLSGILDALIKGDDP